MLLDDLAKYMSIQISDLIYTDFDCIYNSLLILSKRKIYSDKEWKLTLEYLKANTLLDVSFLNSLSDLKLKTIK